jgi:DNA-binding beta-propeller fold protein YncE
MKFSAIFLSTVLMILGILLFESCDKDSLIPAGNAGFPLEVQKIFATKCATSGCHNDLSSKNAAGLNLTSWENLVYEGGVSGSVVIPFRPEFSSLFQFINSYPDLGLTAEPQMPLNGDVLSREEVLTIKNWILEGCKSIDGEIPFQEGFLQRKKVFVANQGCDVVAVIDAESKLVMRYVDVGNKPGKIETPHFMSMSADGQFYYICFTEGDVIQKIDAATGALLGEAQIGTGAWNVVKLSPNGKVAFVSDLSNNGRIARVNTETMTLEQMYSGSNLFTFPHGIESTASGDTLYITAQYGNTFYRFIPAAFNNKAFSLVKGQSPNTISNTYDPHEIIFSPDRSKYFFSCQSSNEVRVFDAKNDTLLKVIDVGRLPLEFTISKKKNLLFVSCSEEPNPNFPSLKGCVDVIDLNSLTMTKRLFGKFFQPHGMVVDESRNQLYVASRNADPTGPPPHHVSECGSRNGYFQVIDINTWQVIRSAVELSVDPYAMIITP